VRLPTMAAQRVASLVPDDKSYLPQIRRETPARDTCAHELLSEPINRLHSWQGRNPHWDTGDGHRDILKMVEPRK
jgi:hypothetical protein